MESVNNSIASYVPYVKSCNKDEYNKKNKIK